MLFITIVSCCSLHLQGEDGGSLRARGSHDRLHAVQRAREGMRRRRIRRLLRGRLRLRGQLRKVKKLNVSSKIDYMQYVL